MADVAVIYLAEDRAEIRSRFEQAARQCGGRLHHGGLGVDTIAEAGVLLPEVVAINTAGSGEADSRLCRRFKSEPRLKTSFLLLLRDEMPVGESWPDAGPDDVLLRSAGVYEITARLQAGLRVARLRREVAWLRAEQERARAFAGGEDGGATAQLVEIAAELQAEVCHSAEREEASVRTAQTAMIAQAAAALRHEINNPLFAILGSAESVLKRLHAVQETEKSAAMEGQLGGNQCAAPYHGQDESRNTQNLSAAIAGLERIQRGGERIQQVVQSISDMLAPATRDYVAGVAMLDLNNKH